MVSSKRDPWQGVEKSYEFQAGSDFALNALRKSWLPS